MIILTLKWLITLLIIRILKLIYKNNYNIKELFLNNFNSNDTLSIDKEQLNMDIFDKYKEFIPCYEGKIYNTSYQYIY